MKKKKKVQEVINSIEKNHFLKVYRMAKVGLNDSGATAEKYLESLGPKLGKEVLDCFSQFVYPELYQASVLLSFYAEYEQAVIAKAKGKELSIDGSA
jgi:hypothetical protein